MPRSPGKGIAFRQVGQFLEPGIVPGTLISMYMYVYLLYTWERPRNILLTCMPDVHMGETQGPLLTCTPAVHTGKTLEHLLTCLPAAHMGESRNTY